MAIAQSLLNQISRADDERIIRAMDALRYGDMEVAILHNDGCLTAEVTSYTVTGKKNPVEKITTYRVLIAPTHSECSCKDWEFRHPIVCKHQIAACLFLEEQAEELKKAA